MGLRDPAALGTHPMPQGGTGEQIDQVRGQLFGMRRRIEIAVATMVHQMWQGDGVGGDDGSAGCDRFERDQALQFRDARRAEDGTVGVRPAEGLVADVAPELDPVGDPAAVGEPVQSIHLGK